MNLRATKFGRAVVDPIILKFLWWLGWFCVVLTRRKSAKHSNSSSSFPPPTRRTKWKIGLQFHQVGMGGWTRKKFFTLFRSNGGATSNFHINFSDLYIIIARICNYFAILFNSISQAADVECGALSWENERDSKIESQWLHMNEFENWPNRATDHCHCRIRWVGVWMPVGGPSNERSTFTNIIVCIVDCSVCSPSID